MLDRISVTMHDHRLTLTSIPPDVNDRFAITLWLSKLGRIQCEVTVGGLCSADITEVKALFEPSKDIVVEGLLKPAVQPFNVEAFQRFCLKISNNPSVARDLLPLVQNVIAVATQTMTDVEKQLRRKLEPVPQKAPPFSLGSTYVMPTPSDKTLSDLVSAQRIRSNY